MEQRKVNRYLVLLAGFVFNFCLSGTSAFSIFVRPMVEHTGWQQGEVALAYTIYNVMLCVFGIVIGAAGSHIRPRPLMYFGSLLFGAGWIVTSYASSLGVTYFGFGVLCGIGGGCLYNFSVTNTLKWFPDKKGFVSGLLLGGAAIGPVFTAPVATMVLEAHGVLAAYRVMGLIFLALMFCVGWMVQVPAPGYRPEGWEPAAVTANAPSGRDYTWKEMLSTPTFYLLYAILVCACTSSMMMLGAAASIGQEQAGMSAGMASLAVSVLAVSNFAGRMFFGSLSDKLGRYATLLLAMAVNTGAMLLLSRMTEPFGFIAVMALVGACGGALLVMFPPITSENFGVKNSGLNYSIMFSGYSIAAFIGPQLAAHYRAAGSYGPAFAWAAGLTVLALALLLLVMRKNGAKKA